MELKCADQQKQAAAMKRDLTSEKKRLADLDVKLKRTYEDNMGGKLPDHIFTMFIADYDKERATLKESIAEMEKTFEKVQDTKAGIDRFADLIRKYTSFEKLDRFMLHELIDRITIYETPEMGCCCKGKEKRITIFRGWIFSSGASRKRRA
jgi:site-specific DNA recombinase